MSVRLIKEELKQLGAKTTGPKKVLERRLAIWKEKPLNKTLFVASVVPVEPVVNVPSDNNFQPLSSLYGTKLVDINAIQKWFHERKAKKGLEKGRILALKLFIKFTKIAFQDNHWYIKGNCCAEQKKNYEYNVQIIVFKDNKQKPVISHCTCSCPAGAGWSAACKHISALCFSLEYFSLTGKTQEYVSCTAEPMSWNKPSAGRGIDYMSIFEIIKKPKTHYSECEKYTDDTINKLINYKISCPLTHNRKANMDAYVNDHGITSNARFEKPSSTNDIIEEQKIQENVFIDDVEIDWNYIESLETIFFWAEKSSCLNQLQVITPTRQCCMEVFNNLILNNKVLEIAMNTKDNKILWNKERQFRITGSRCYALYTYKNDDWHVKSLNYFWPKGFSNKFVSYGLRTENEARMVYKTHNNYDVIETGVIISKIHPWLAYSPDGVVVENGKPIKLLEIKCPFIGKEKGAVHFVDHCDFLVIENGDNENCRLTVKKKHAYYAQVQLGMAVLNLPECDFVVYSKHSKTFLNIIIKLDLIFIEELLSKLQNIYFSKMLHEICIEKGQS